MSLDVVVVPLKSFASAKQRLREGGIEHVSELAERLAIGVLRACAPRHVIVLSNSDDATTFARANGVGVWTSDHPGLNNAVQGSYQALGSQYDRFIVVHGDLVAPDGLGAFEPGPGVTIVADHHGQGTNVLVLPTGLDFTFGYGPSSAHHHQREAQRLGLDWQLLTDSPWQFDIDEPADLDRARKAFEGAKGPLKSQFPEGNIETTS